MSTKKYRLLGIYLKMYSVRTIKWFNLRIPFVNSICIYFNLLFFFFELLTPCIFQHCVMNIITVNYLTKIFRSKLAFYRYSQCSCMYTYLKVKFPATAIVKTKIHLAVMFPVTLLFHHSVYGKYRLFFSYHTKNIMSPHLSSKYL